MSDLLETMQVVIFSSICYWAQKWVTWKNPSYYVPHNRWKLTKTRSNHIPWTSTRYSSNFRKRRSFCSSPPHPIVKLLKYQLVQTLPMHNNSRRVQNLDIALYNVCTLWCINKFWKIWIAGPLRVSGPNWFHRFGLHMIKFEYKLPTFSIETVIKSIMLYHISVRIVPKPSNLY